MPSFRHGVKMPQFFFCILKNVGQKLSVSEYGIDTEYNGQIVDLCTRNC